jgi:hypothetical protein
VLLGFLIFSAVLSDVVFFVDGAVILLESKCHCIDRVFIASNATASVPPSWYDGLSPAPAGYAPATTRILWQSGSMFYRLPAFADQPAHSRSLE